MSDEQRNGLRPGWAWTTLGEITQPTRPRHNPKEYPALPFIGMEHVEAHTMRLLGTVPAASMQSSSVYFYPNYVLYGRLRPYLNKVYRPDFEGLCSAEFIVFPNSEQLSSKYLQYFLNSSAFVSFATHLNQGDRPRVDYEQIAFYSIALAPLPEQQRIVEEIERRLSVIEEVETIIRTNLKRAEVLRQRILQHAFTGKLVAQDPDKEPAGVLLERIRVEKLAREQAAKVARKPVTGKRQRARQRTASQTDDLPFTIEEVRV